MKVPAGNGTSARVLNGLTWRCTRRTLPHDFLRLKVDRDQHSNGGQYFEDASLLLSSTIPVLGTAVAKNSKVRTAAIRIINSRRNE